MTRLRPTLTPEELDAARAAANQTVSTDLSPMVAFREGFLAAKLFYRLPQNIAHMYPELANLLPEQISSERPPEGESLMEENRRLTRELEAAKKLAEDRRVKVLTFQRELSDLRARVRNALFAEDEE